MESGFEEKEIQRKGKTGSQKPVVNTRIDSWTLQGKNEMRCQCESEVCLNKGIKWKWAILIYK